MIALYNIADSCRIVYSEHVLSCRISVYTGKLMVVVERHFEVSRMTVVAEEIDLGKKVEGIGVVLSCCLLEKFNRV